MSTQTVTTITTQPLMLPISTVNIEQEPPPTLNLEVLTYVESMNNQVQSETNLNMQTFILALAKMQKTLEATIQENLAFKNRIIQLETINDENTRLHTAEVKKHTEMIATFSKTVNQLTNDLRTATAELAEQKKNFQALTENYNAHNHSTNLNSCGTGYWYLQASTGPSTPYKPEKK